MQSIINTVYHSGDLLAKRPHFHDCHQIILILKGQVEFFVNDTCFQAGAGHIAIFSRYENHSVRVQSGEYERYVLHIAPHATDQVSPVYSLLTDRPVGFLNVTDVSPYLEEVAAIFRRLLQEHGSQRKLAREMEQLAVWQLLIIIYRAMPIELDSLGDATVMSIKRQFEKDCSRQYTLSSLARQYSISISSLAHRFRAVTGTSVMEYLQSCRIAQAKRLLANTHTPIGEIVESCGFSDSSNFSRTFKRLTGMSPSGFRKKYKTE